MTSFVAVALVMILVSAVDGEGAQGDTAAAGGAFTGAAAARGPVLDGPPPPVPPAVISRDPSGRITGRAVSVAVPPRIDGRLDESAYTSVPAMSDFVQTEPAAGAPATEKTEVWVFFDDRALYVTGRCWESRPERMVVNEMRRDNTGIAQGESIAFVFDTFYDRRNGFDFETNPLGGRLDLQITNETANRDWNPVWEVAVARFDGGWTFEAVVPFRSLRYRPGPGQIWGFNVRRHNRWKNEISFLAPVPAQMGMSGILKVSQAGTLVGVDAPGSSNLELKPYFTSSVSTDATATPRAASDVGADVGIDVKYGITQNLTADFTYNTDFAQVEADEQQVNLTRFNLAFPEKRDFFLENAGLFGFGGVSSTNASGDAPALFYSRRIGLDDGADVPIDAGGRLTGKVGEYGIGVLHVRTGDDGRSGSPATDFSVVRLRRDILRRSSVGAMVTRRSSSQRGSGSNEAYGVDGTFAFLTTVTVHAYLARTRTDGLSGADTSHRAQFRFDGDRYGIEAERLLVGANFNPEIGFVRRDDMLLHSGLFRFSPRPRAIESIRKLFWTGAVTHVRNGAGQTETRTLRGTFEVELQNGDRLVTEHTVDREALLQPFQIAPGLTLPPGTFQFGNTRVGYNFGRQRPVSGNVSVEHGSFYSGRKTALVVRESRVNLTPQFSIEPTYATNWIDLPEGSFTTHLFGSRLTWTMTPLVFTSALLQYNSTSDTVTANVRLRWEYRPGSEIFVVYDEQRDTLAPRFPGLENRVVIVKVTLWSTL